jgi:hypothetical protein
MMKFKKGMTEVKGKRNGGPVYAVKAHSLNKSIAPLILKLDARWRHIVNFTPRPPYPP